MGLILPDDNPSGFALIPLLQPLYLCENPALWLQVKAPATRPTASKFRRRPSSAHRMSRKRTSLQSLGLFMPGLFLTSTVEDPPKSPVKPHTSLFHTWGHSSTSPWRSTPSPPPDFLLDEDPFANLAAGPGATEPSPVSPVSPSSAVPIPSAVPAPVSPRSPLAAEFDHPPTAPVRTVTTQARSATQKPAFQPRPSLPSLRVLAETNFVVPHRIRRGRVGAGLPAEPWDFPPPSPSPAPEVHTSTSVSADDIEMDFLDFSSDEVQSLDSLDMTFMSSSESLILPEPQFSSHDQDDFDEQRQPTLSRSSSLSSASSSSSGSFDDDPLLASPVFLYESPVSQDSTESDSSEDPEFFTFPSANLHSLSEYTWGSTDYSSTEYSPTPHTSVLFPADTHIIDSEVVFEPGTSAGTIRALNVPRKDSNNMRRSAVLLDMWNKLDDEPTDAGEWDGYRRGDSKWSGNGDGSGNSGGRSNRGNDSYPGGRGSGGYPGGDDDGRDNSRKPPVTSAFSSSETSSDDEEEEEDEDDTDVYGPPSAKPQAENSDDDVPLAKSIPTALKAQRTIRIRAREERDERRKQRAARAEKKLGGTLPPGASSPNSAPMMSSSQEAALHAMKALQRQRAQTLGGGSKPFALEDVNKKLNEVQTAMESGSSSLVPPPRTSTDRVGAGLLSPTEPPRLRAKSISRPQRSRTVDPTASMPPDADRLVRSATRARSHVRDDISKPSAAPVVTDLSELPASADLERKHTKLVKSVERGRPSADIAAVSLPPSRHVARGSVAQQRIFVGDLQRFHMVEVEPTTNAGHVIKMIEDQGGLKGWVGTGGWMVWEIAQDFGMERPIRSYELLADVEASWNKDKMVNTFIIKLTPLEPLLSRAAMPKSSPVCSGYVEWEIKRGKWAKRWLSLREHSLYLSKRDNSRDDVLICSLSNFDFYKVTRTIKAPKPFVFALKSTDNLSFFENTADYLHTFCCKEPDGAKWMERILLARSYVLHQEKNVLFNPKAAGPSALARAPTRKSTTSQRSGMKTQPLVTMPAPLVKVAPDDVFEPGSLLHNK